MSGKTVNVKGVPPTGTDSDRGIRIQVPGAYLRPRPDFPQCIKNILSAYFRIGGKNSLPDPTCNSGYTFHANSPTNIVVGRQGLSRKERFLFGSISSKIVSHADNCTVWVVS